MTEKKRPSVAEILAAARASGTKDKPADEKNPAEAPEPGPVAASDTASAESAPPPAAPPAEAPPKPAITTGDKPKIAPGERPKTADILAMARAAKAKASPEAPAEQEAKPAAEAAPRAAKPAAAPTAKAASQPAAEAPSGPKDTASIMAAARTGAKPGPMSKAEAARLKPAEPAGTAKHETAKAGKPKPVVPPMPAKPDYAKPKPAKADVDEDRRGVLGFMLGSFLGMGFTSLSATAALWGLGTARFMFPNILTEPPSQFKVGFPSDFAPASVADKFKAQFGVWVVNWEYNGQKQIFALRSVCTHLGCTPNWLEGEQKFKCPCHGSGFYKDGINFEGPAPRPLERYAIRVADDGQLEIDKSKIFQEELGQWSDPTCYVAV